MRLIVLIYFLFAITLPAFSQKKEKVVYCSVCKEGPLVGKVWIFRDTEYVCRDCYRLDTRCSLCGLPVKDKVTRTSDGRVICKFDAPNTVLSTEGAKELFEETRTELTHLFKGLLDLKSPNLSVSLFDVDYWNTRSRIQDNFHRVGFSHTRHSGKELFHSIILLGGRPKVETMAVCAHEYAHLWLNENVAKSRTIEPDTIEAICELVAYKLMVERNEREQIEKIKKNTYTKGQITTWIEAESALGIIPLINWIKYGETETLDLPSFVAPKPPPADEVRLYALATPEPPLPDKLILKGLGGTKSKPLALINSRTFEKMEEGKIKLRDGTVSVRCLEILADSVVVSVDGSSSPITLKLEPSAK